MKQTIMAFAFAIFSAGVPVLMAQAVAQDAEAVVAEPAVESGVEIEIEGLSSRQEEQIRDVLEEFSDVFGDRFSAKLAVDVDSLSERDKDRLDRAFERIGADHAPNLMGFSIGHGEVLIAMTAITLSLGMPVIILIVVFIFAAKKRRQMMELAGMYIQADQPMPEHVMAEFGTGMSADKRLRSGIQMLLLGVAVTAILGTFAGDAAVLGLIPIAIGLARILYWRYESRVASERSEGLPELPAE